MIDHDGYCQYASEAVADLARPRSGSTPSAHPISAALSWCLGTWAPLAKSLRYEWDSIQKVATGKKAALRVARFAGVGMDELLAGKWLSARVCPHCGHPPDDFMDEETVVE